MILPPPLEEVSSSGRSVRFKAPLGGHIDAREFEVFRQIVLAADPDEVEEAARDVAVARSS